MTDVLYNFADACSGCGSRTCRDCYKYFHTIGVCPIDSYYHKAKKEYENKTSNWYEFKREYPISAAYVHGKLYCTGHDCTSCKALIGTESCPADMAAETQEELKIIGYKISVTDLEEILCQ